RAGGNFVLTDEWVAASPLCVEPSCAICHHEPRRAGSVSDRRVARTRPLSEFRFTPVADAPGSPIIYRPPPTHTAYTAPPDARWANSPVGGRPVPTRCRRAALRSAHSSRRTP